MFIYPSTNLMFMSQTKIWMALALIGGLFLMTGALTHGVVFGMSHNASMATNMTNATGMMGNATNATSTGNETGNISGLIPGEG